MQALQSQIQTLSSKIDALYDVVERISLKLAESASSSPTCADHLTSCSSSSQSLMSTHFSENGLGHKDILDDHQFLDGHRDQNLPPELQIQRLTAQLTAAYNRIAALEEQLLASRVHH